MNSFINVLFSSVVGIGFLIWYSVTKNWMLIPVFVVGIVVLGSLTGLLSRKIKTTQRSINRETNKMSGVITESLRNIELVKSLGLTFPEIRRLKEQTLRIFELEMEKVRKVRTLTFLQGTMLSVLKQSILFILLWLIFRKILTTGELITMQFISTSIFGPLQDLGNIILSYREVEASISSFDHLLSKPIERRPENPLRSAATASVSTMSYSAQNSDSNAIDEISFQVRGRRHHRLCRASGSAIHLVKLLVGLYTRLPVRSLQ
jgi:ATP-binding cassette subfamily B protein